MAYGVYDHPFIKILSLQRASSAVNQNEYGKYGIIKDEHFYHKQRWANPYIMLPISIQHICLKQQRV